MSEVGTPVTSGPVFVERRTTDDADSLSYDNGETRYDYDLRRGGTHDDISGRGGYGYTAGDHDVYVSGSFDEATGDLAGSLASEHTLNPDTTLRTNASINDKGDTSHSVGLNHHLGEDGVVDVEVGEDGQRGRYLEGQWSNDHEDGSDRIHYSASDKHGAAVTYDGRRSGDGWEINTSMKADDEGQLEGAVSGSLDLDLGKNNVGRLSGDVDLEGNWIAAGDFTHNLSEDESLSHGLRLDSKDNAEVYVGRNHGSDSERFTLTHVAKDDATSIRYRGHHEGESWRTDESVDIDAKGNVTGQVSGEHRHTLDENAELTTGGTLRLDGSWDANAAVDRRIDENLGLRHSVRINSKGETETTHGINVMALDGRAAGDASYSYDQDGNRTVNATASYSGDDGNAVSGGVAWSDKGGIASNVEGLYNYDPNTALTGSFFHDGGAGMTGTSIGLRRTNIAGKGSAGANLAFASNDAMETAELGGDLNLANILAEGSALGIGLGTTDTRLKRTIVWPTMDEIGGIREAVLADAPEGTAFVGYGATKTSRGNFGFSVPIGPAHVNTGFEANTSYDVKMVRLSDAMRLGEAPSEEELRVPANADELLAFKPGESFSIEGASHHAVRGGGGLGFSHGPLSAKAGVEAGLAFDGKLKTEVFRGGRTSARMVLSKADMDSTEGGLNVKVGLSPQNLIGDSLPSFPDIDPRGPILAVIVQLILGIIERFLSLGARWGKESGQGDSRLVDVALDLGSPEVRRAYDRALGGDWSEVERLARDGHPGVDLDRSIFTEITTKSIPLALHGLGMDYMADEKETLRTSDVVTDDGTYDVESDHDQNVQTFGTMFKKTSYTVGDFSRTIENTEGGELGDLKASEHWMRWKHEHRDTFTSKEELVASTALVRYLGDEATQASLSAYVDKVEKLEPRRKLWVGPRSELRNTTISTEVVISDAGLDALIDCPADAVWDSYGRAWQALHPNEPAPAWTYPEGRARLMGGTADWIEMLDYAEFEAAKDMVDSLTRAADICDEEKRHDAIRAILFSHRDDSAWVAATADLAGREHIRIKFDVDSKAGAGGREYDFSSTQAGAEFDVQAKVFGERL